MAFGIKSDLNDQDEGLKPLETKPVEAQEPASEVVETTEEPPLKVAEDLKPLEAKTEDKPVVEDVNTELKLNDDLVSKYLRSKYKDREFESLDDFIKTPEPIEKEVEKIVNPYEDILDEEDKAYLDYKKETGRSRREFDFLQQDISKLSPLDLAQKQVQSDTGMNLSKEETKEYLTETLGIDFSEDALSTTDKIKLNGFVKPTRENHLEQQEKYRKPLEAKLQAKANAPKPEMVELEDGGVMPKAEYEQLVEDRRIYTESLKKAVDSVASFDFSIPIDNNGEKTDLSISYELSKDDKHSMLSDALDVNATIKREFQTEKGFNHSELAQTLYRGQAKNFNKIMNAVAEQVRAATIEELASNSNNENFTRKPLETLKKSKEGYGELPNGERRPRAFGVRAGGI